MLTTRFWFKNIITPALLSLVLIMSVPGTALAVRPHDPIGKKMSSSKKRGSMLVEISSPLPRRPRGVLATTGYMPTDRERSAYSKIAPDEQITGSLLESYSINNRDGNYVGWFGIVRKIEEDEKTDHTRLLVEMKYFDGHTDSHIMTVSFNGDGDFEAVVPGTGLGIKPLSLVKVYGVVEQEKDQVDPQVNAEFIRVWDWGLFNFMDYGADNGNPNWKKENKILPKHIYEPYPHRKYYENRLGLQPEHTEEIELPPIQAGEVVSFSGFKEPVLYLKEIEQPADVLSLDLSYSALEDDEMSQLARFKNLGALNLAGTKITDKGLRVLKSFPHLLLLLLDGTEVTDEGVKALSSISTLKGLSLAKTKVSDGAMSSLEKLTNLKRLDLSNTRATEEGAGKLKAKLPSCQVELK